MWPVRRFAPHYGPSHGATPSWAYGPRGATPLTPGPSASCPPGKGPLAPRSSGPKALTTAGLRPAHCPKGKRQGFALSGVLPLCRKPGGFAGPLAPNPVGFAHGLRPIAPSGRAKPPGLLRRRGWGLLRSHEGLRPLIGYASRPIGSSFLGASRLEA